MKADEQFLQELIKESERLIENNELDEARKLLLEILQKHDPENIDAANNYAVTEIMLGNYESAEDLLKQILEKDAGNEIAIGNLKYSQLQLKNKISKAENDTQKNSIIKLHLGCGEKYLDGYINIDYPSKNHDLMKVKADIYEDISRLNFKYNSIDEIRLHHVFEHFNRIETIGLLVNWHLWLKKDGVLKIETPDFDNCARIFLDPRSDLQTKMGLIRHLEGDQAADWAIHRTQWFDERLTFILKEFGFEISQKNKHIWNKKPFLANIVVTAIKKIHFDKEQLIEKGLKILELSLIDYSEKPTHDKWKEQLIKFLYNDNKQEEHISFSYEKPSSISLNKIHKFNQTSRDEWIKSKAIGIKKGSKVLDVGAGTCPYRADFSHCDYKTHDFMQYGGVKLGGTNEYGEIDYVSDIVDIPAIDNEFDLILCTEVLEHVPEPIKAIKEMARILKQNGHILLTAPLGSGLHQLPYHYYGGFTPEWYNKFLNLNGIEIVEIQPNGGFFRHIAQECARVAWLFNKHEHLHEDKEGIFKLFNEFLPQLLHRIDNEVQVDEFTVGYFIHGIKK